MYPMIDGRLVRLRPAVMEDRRKAYEWLACSDLTSSMIGPPDFPESPIPSWEEFCSDYLHFFDGTAPEDGRSFIIVAGGEDVGMINHNEIILERQETEFDIWLRSARDCGKGYGSDAIETLSGWLHERYGLERFIIRPSRRNTRAVAAYRRAGFRELPLTMEEQTREFGPGDYHDTVTMLKVV